MRSLGRTTSCPPATSRSTARRLTSATYAGSGLFTRELAIPTLVVALAIAGGNAIGERLRKVLSDRTTARLEYGVLVVCVGVSLAGAL